MTDVQGDTATAAVTDQAGIVVPPDPNNPITFSGDNPAVCAVTDNGDGTCSLKAVAPGTMNLTASDKNGDTAAAEVVTITLSAGRKLTITFGTPA